MVVKNPLVNGAALAVTIYLVDLIFEKIIANLEDKIPWLFFFKTSGNMFSKPNSYNRSWSSMQMILKDVGENKY